MPLSRVCTRDLQVSNITPVIHILSKLARIPALSLDKGTYNAAEILAPATGFSVNVEVVE
jgi:hypothetical protein